MLTSAKPKNDCDTGTKYYEFGHNKISVLCPTQQQPFDGVPNFMVPNPSKKNKIVLTDYNYRRDIDNRLLMSTFTVFEVEVLQEILCSSLTLKTDELCDEIDSSIDEVLPVLQKLSKTGLLRINGDTITVDKEMRRYYDLQIEKFDDNFRPDLDFIQETLNKVPIQHLPAWYCLPRSTDHIFETIVERYLISPRIYWRYLAESQFEDPVVRGIIRDIQEAPDFKVRSKDLREKYQLTREIFEEYMLYLEFNFVCYLSYNQVDDHWKEVVTPYWPMWNYLRFLRDTRPISIRDSESIKRHDHEDFHFVRLMSQALEQPGHIEELACSATEREEVREKLACLRLIEHESAELEVRPEAQEWLSLSMIDRAIMLYRHPDFQLHGSTHPMGSDRNFRRIERSLRRVRDAGWITFSEFMKGCAVSLGEDEAVVLEKKGRQWVYSIPTYSEPERDFIRRVVFERFFQVGLVHIGEYQGEPCFCLTPFGRESLQD